MKKVKIDWIDWIDWIQKLNKKQLWALAIIPTVILIVLLLVRIETGNEAYNQNWFIYFCAVLYAAAFSPIGEQIQFRLFPQSIPHNQYQVTTWSQWKQAMITATVLMIISLLFWPIQKQGEIAVHLIAAIIVGFLSMWTIRMVRGMRQEKKRR